MAKIQIKSMKLTPFGEEYFNREQLSTLFGTNQHLLSVGEKTHCDARNERMRIAALQYANGQVKHCDGLIEAPQCFFRFYKV